MPERFNILKKIVESDVWNEGLAVNTVKTIMDKDRPLSSKVWKATSFAALTATMAACANQALTPVSATPESGAAPTPGTTEVAPATEVDPVKKGNFVWTASQESINEVASGTGLSAESVSGYTIKVDRTDLGLPPLDIEFVTAREPVLDASGAPTGQIVDRDYMMTDRAVKPAEPLYRKSYDRNGQQWIVQYAYSQYGEEIVVQEYPADTTQRLANGESVKMLFYPNIDQRMQLAKSDSKPIEVTVSPRNETVDVPTLPTPFSVQMVSFVLPTATPLPSMTPVSTATAEATKTPEVSFNCVANPDDPAATEIHSLTDLPKLADWVMRQPSANMKMSANPSNLDYMYDEDKVTDFHIRLSTQPKDDPGWSAKNSAFFGVCRINPELFGFAGKTDGRLLVTVIQDSQDQRMVQFTFVSAHYARELANKGWFTSEYEFIQPVDMISSYWDQEYIPKGAEPGGPEDLRVMKDTNTFYAAQNTTQEKVRGAFKEIAETDTFTPNAREVFKTTVFFGAGGSFYRP